MNSIPDITMCRNEECSKKEKCYRYTAIPSRIQSFFSPYPDEKGCEYFYCNQSMKYKENSNGKMVVQKSTHN